MNLPPPQNYDQVDVEQLYLDHGMHAPWTRVWANGVDVTDQPDLWPALWRNEKRPSRPARHRGQTRRV